MKVEIMSDEEFRALLNRYRDLSSGYEHAREAVRWGLNNEKYINLLNYMSEIREKIYSERRDLIKYIKELENIIRENNEN